MLPVGYFYGSRPQHSRLDEHSFLRVMLEGEPADLNLQLLDVGIRGSISLVGNSLTATPKEVRFPSCHSVGMNFKLLCNIRNRFVTPKSGNSHLGLERC